MVDTRRLLLVVARMLPHSFRDEKGAPMRIEGGAGPFVRGDTWERRLFPYPFAPPAAFLRSIHGEMG